jgi:hypothetical protein
MRVKNGIPVERQVTIAFTMSTLHMEALVNRSGKMAQLSHTKRISFHSIPRGNWRAEGLDKPSKMCYHIDILQYVYLLWS